MELIASGRNARNGKQLDTSSDSGRPHSVLSEGRKVLWVHYIVHAWPILRFSLGVYYWHLLLADPVSQGKVETVSSYQKLSSWGSWSITGISTSGVWRIGFTLENPPSVTVVSPLPGKQKATGLDRLLGGSRVMFIFASEKWALALLVFPPL